ncbi:MAG: hypothetical protein U0270_41340 [Labilithrix sp.]
MRRLLGLLLLCACDRSGGAAKPADSVDATAPAAASAAASPAASAAPVKSAAPPSATLPKVERVEAKTCPARIASVKLAEGRVDLTGCPEDAKTRTPGKARLTLVDAKGTEKSAVQLADGAEHSEKLEVNDLYGTGRPVFFVTVAEPTAGGSNGPITSMYEVEGDKLVPLRVAGKNGGTGGEITMKDSLTVHWWLHPARGGRGQDIYLLTAPHSGAVTGYRYAFENGKWVVRSGELKKWTGEHLKDTEAEFP